MEMIGKTLICCAAGTLILLIGAQAQAAPWTNPSGTAPSGHFTWDGGHDDNDLFKSPVVTPDDRFVFRFANMGVSTQSGGYALIEDTVYFNIHLTPGFTLNQLEVRARGSWDVAGTGSKVDLDASLAVEEYETQPGQSGPRTFTDTLTTTPVTFPVVVGDSQPLSGTWAGIATEVLAGTSPDNDLHISFHDILQAWAAATGTAQINLSFQQAEFEILIPEPATLLLLAAGGLVLLRRR
jgi:hypothetical protein